MRPVTFLFWNLANKDLGAALASIAAEHDADVIVLAEPEMLSLDFVLASLSRHADFRAVDTSRRLMLLSRFERGWFEPCGEEAGERKSRWLLWRLRLPGKESVLPASVHLRSRLRAEPIDQYEASRRLASAIVHHEAVQRHRRTVALGDFNMDPFEDGMVACDGMHAILSRREIEVRNGRRILVGGEYPMFFNPMWRHLGEAEGTAPGTYYYSSTGVKAQYWHTFDQVLLRPDLMNSLESVNVIQEAGGLSLLDGNGRPDSARFSDHLPLLIRLRI